MLERVGRGLDRVAAAERVDGGGDARLERHELLRAQRQPRRGLGRQRERLVACAFVCRLWQPPSTAASAWSATRTTLLSGCCAVSVTPPVWTWKRHCCARGFADPEPVAREPGPQPPRAAELGDLLEEVGVAGEEEGEPLAHAVGIGPGARAPRARTRARSRR